MDLPPIKRRLSFPPLANCCSEADHFSPHLLIVPLHCWVLWSLIVFNPNYDLTRNNFVIWTEPPWGFGGNTPRKNFWHIFVIHYESYAQDIKTVVLKIRFLISFLRGKTVLPYFVFFLENNEILATPGL